jgi:predicted RNase H-like HicB family nuclease
MRYSPVLEIAADGKWGAYFTDLPLVFVAGYDTREEALESLALAEEFHLEGLREAGLPIPEPRR